MIRFWLAREPLGVISNNHFESAIKGIGTSHPFAFSNCEHIANASSNMSANAITSADSTERATRLDSYL